MGYKSPFNQLLIFFSLQEDMSLNSSSEFSQTSDAMNSGAVRKEISFNMEVKVEVENTDNNDNYAKTNGVGAVNASSNLCHESL